MPHVIVKHFPGKSEEEKARLARKITEDIVEIYKFGEETVSVALEEVSPQDWREKVVQPEIKPNLDKLYKKPGYPV